MTQTIRTHNPVLQEIEADNFRRLAMYRSWSREDMRAGRPSPTWNMLARSSIASIRRVRRDQVEMG